MSRIVSAVATRVGWSNSVFMVYECPCGSGPSCVGIIKVPGSDCSGARPEGGEHESCCGKSTGLDFCFHEKHQFLGLSVDFPDGCRLESFQRMGRSVPSSRQAASNYDSQNGPRKRKFTGVLAANPFPREAARIKTATGKGFHPPFCVAFPDVSQKGRRGGRKEGSPGVSHRCGARARAG